MIIYLSFVSMQWKAPSSLASITSLFLLSAVDLVVAQITAPSCTDTVTSWQWAFNSLGQNPCTVVGYLLGTCYNGEVTIGPLNPGSPAYAGPTKEEALQADSCWCNTVIYNLASACSECQGAESLLWTEYYENCTTILAPATFPNPVPAGTRVPQWVLLDIPSTGYWSPTAAKLVGDIPEILPGGLLNKPATLPSSSTPSHTIVTEVPTLTSTISTPSHSFVQTPTDPSPTPTPTSSSGKVSNQGAVVGMGSIFNTTMAAITGLILILFS